MQISKFIFHIQVIHCPEPMKVTVHHVQDQGPLLHIRVAMVHPDTDPEALGQDKPALTVLVVMGHFHELTMNINFVRYTIFGAFCHCIEVRFASFLSG
jgi:hypothetical protein